MRVPLFIFRTSLIAAAMCSALSWAQVHPGALPTGWNVTSGAASIVQSGATLNIHQTTSQALVNFATFNVGAGALVDLRQPDASSSLLARTTGGDPSQILGQIKANGALWLINPAGIMVGAGARIDVGSFIASTLNVSDSDYLAGRLTFNSPGSAGAINNAGIVNASNGGSIYLVAPNVTNTGTLQAPKGEIILAAGQDVRLVDTGTPGVSVALGGIQGEARNLGRILADAGRIGLSAGLIANSGTIQADSAVSEGGRVFLRASNNLSTTPTSSISANGTTGGRVVLYADNAADIGGHVSAVGTAGKGGFVDTSGRRRLDVANVPVLGRGGEWLIDPLNLEVADFGNGGVSGTNAIVSSESGARVAASTIVAMLDAGTDVSLTTGNAFTDAGDITVSAPINVTGAFGANLSFNAHNAIVINAAITSTNSALNLNLNSAYQRAGVEAGPAVELNADLNLGGGVLNVSAGLGGNGNGTLNIASGTTLLSLPTSGIRAATVNVLAGSTLAIDRPGTPIVGRLNNAGNLVLGSSGQMTFDFGSPNMGTITLDPGSSISTGGADFQNDGTLTGAGTWNLGGAAGGTFINNGTVAPGAGILPGRIAILGNYSQSQSGLLDIHVSGWEAGRYDVLDVQGSASIGGTLQLHTVGSLPLDSIESADVFVARGSNNSGAFSQINTPPPIVNSEGTTGLQASTVLNGSIVTQVGRRYTPSLDACLANPAMPACANVLPTIAACTANSAAIGCSVVLPSLAACVSNPVFPGCQVVLPSLSSCTARPSSAGCAVVLPSIAQCVASPGLQGCSVVVPSLASCVASPSRAGCSVVLPTLSQCTSSPLLQGCSVVLPPVGSCAVSPQLPGCAVVLPSRTIVSTIANDLSNVTASLQDQDRARQPSAPGKADGSESPSSNVASAGADVKTVSKKMYCN